jgi:hypothetical protein
MRDRSGASVYFLPAGEATDFEQFGFYAYMPLMAQTRTENHDNITYIWKAIDAIKRQKRLAAGAPGNVWAPIPGTRFFSRNGEGVYERLTDRLFLRVDKADDGDEVDPEVAESLRGLIDAASQEGVAGQERRLDISSLVISGEDEEQIERILLGIDSKLAIEEAFTEKLLLRFGL